MATMGRTAPRAQATHLIGDTGILLLVGLAVGLANILTNGQYGFHRDELDIIMSARQLDWGYVSYPPLTPFLARIALTLFGTSLIGMRLLPALCQGVVAVLVGLMVRDLGGRRSAQVLGAVAVVISPIALTTGMLIQYMSFDYFWWVVIAFCVIRLLATDNPRWWLGIGAAVGLGLMNKYTVAYFVAGLAAGVLLTSARRYLRSPWLWAGAGLALLICLPNLIWQAQHGFISLKFLSAIHARDIQWGRAEGYWVKQLYEEVNPIVLPLAVVGLIWAAFLPAGRRFRALAWMFVVPLVAMGLSQGRSYYPAPAYPMLVACGAVVFTGWLANRQPGVRKGLGIATGVLLAVGAVAAIAVAKPVAPINSGLWKVTSSLSDGFAEMIGWPEMAEQVAGIYAGVPDAEKPRTAILAANYGEAGALDLYGPQYGLPRIVSPANSLWYRGYGDPTPETVIAVGFELSQANSIFRSCKGAGVVKNRYNVKNEETTRHYGLFVCRQPYQPWAQLWPAEPWFE